MDFTQLKQLFTDEDAVSPVIGVILMVAITVILAAVIGTFVLGLGENVQDSAPQANFQFEYENTGDADYNNDVIVITHTGGEDIELSSLAVQAGPYTLYNGGTFNTDTNSTTASDTELNNAVTDVWTDPVSTGDALRLEESDTGDSVIRHGDTVRVVWTSPSGGTSNTIGQSTVPN